MQNNSNAFNDDESQQNPNQLSHHREPRKFEDEYNSSRSGRAVRHLDKEEQKMMYNTFNSQMAKLQNANPFIDSSALSNMFHILRQTPPMTKQTENKFKQVYRQARRRSRTLKREYPKLTAHDYPTIEGWSLPQQLTNSQQDQAFESVEKMMVVKPDKAIIEQALKEQYKLFINNNKGLSQDQDEFLRRNPPLDKIVFKPRKPGQPRPQTPEESDFTEYDSQESFGDISLGPLSQKSTPQQPINSQFSFNPQQRDNYGVNLQNSQQFAGGDLNNLNKKNTSYITQNYIIINKCMCQELDDFKSENKINERIIYAKF